MPREDQGVGSSEPRSESWELPAPREVFDIAHDAFLSLDADGRILYANPRAEELFGLFPLIGHRCPARLSSCRA